MFAMVCSLISSSGAANCTGAGQQKTNGLYIAWTRQVPMRKTWLLPLMVLVSLGLALLVLEWFYRLQLVDTYRPELHTFNPSQALALNTKPTLLVMGDSFTASRTSYAGILQDTLQEWRIINAAVSGTGVLQALYMAPRRFAQF